MAVKAIISDPGVGVGNITAVGVGILVITDVLVGLGTGVGSGVIVGTGVLLGLGVGIGVLDGLGVGTGVLVGLGVGVGSGVFVGTGVLLGLGVGIGVLVGLGTVVGVGVAIGFKVIFTPVAVTGTYCGFAGSVSSIAVVVAVFIVAWAVKLAWVVAAAQVKVATLKTPVGSLLFKVPGVFPRCIIIFPVEFAWVMVVFPGSTVGKSVPATTSLVSFNFVISKSISAYTAAILFVAAFSTNWVLPDPGKVRVVGNIEKLTVSPVA
jgi:hypothetical protein